MQKIIKNMLLCLPNVIEKSKKHQNFVQLTRVALGGGRGGQDGQLSDFPPFFLEPSP